MTLLNLQSITRRTRTTKEPLDTATHYGRSGKKHGYLEISKPQTYPMKGMGKINKRGGPMLILMSNNYHDIYERSVLDQAK